MTVSAALARARVAMEATMLDTATIDRTTLGTFNPTTGVHAEQTANHYSGKCRLRGVTAAHVNPIEREAGDAEQVTTRYALLIPYSADISAVLPGDVATVNDNETYTVIGRLTTTTQTAKSLLVERLEG